MNVPNEYTKNPERNLNENTDHYTGTDMYLTAVTVFLTAVLTKTVVTLFLFANDFIINPNVVQSAMVITSVLAARNCLTGQNNHMYKHRVTNSIVEAVKSVVIAPFSAVAQIARSTTNGFAFTRNLFD